MDAPTGWFLVLVMLAAVAVGLLPGLLFYWLPEWWLTRRDQRAWDRGEAARRRRWAEEDRRRALQQQLRDMEEAIRRESLPDWQREALDAADRQRVAIRREARRRLGLPDTEEEP